MTDKIEFTREDSNRLVRIETNLSAVLEQVKLQNGRVGQLENNQKKFVYFGSGVIFLLTAKTFGILTAVGKFLGFV